MQGRPRLPRGVGCATGLFAGFNLPSQQQHRHLSGLAQLGPPSRGVPVLSSHAIPLSYRSNDTALVAPNQTRSRVNPDQNQASSGSEVHVPEVSTSELGYYRSSIRLSIPDVIKSHSAPSTPCDHFRQGSVFNLNPHSKGQVKLTGFLERHSSWPMATKSQQEPRTPTVGDQPSLFTVYRVSDGPPSLTNTGVEETNQEAMGKTHLTQSADLPSTDPPRTTKRSLSDSGTERAKRFSDSGISTQTSKESAVWSSNDSGMGGLLRQSSVDDQSPSALNSSQTRKHFSRIYSVPETPEPLNNVTCPVPIEQVFLDPGWGQGNRSSMTVPDWSILCPHSPSDDDEDDDVFRTSHQPDEDRHMSDMECVQSSIQTSPELSAASVFSEPLTTPEPAMTIPSLSGYATSAFLGASLPMANLPNPYLDHQRVSENLLDARRKSEQEAYQRFKQYTLQTLRQVFNQMVEEGRFEQIQSVLEMYLAQFGSQVEITTVQAENLRRELLETGMDTVQTVLDLNAEPMQMGSAEDQTMEAEGGTAEQFNLMQVCTERDVVMRPEEILRYLVAANQCQVASCRYIQCIEGQDILNQLELNLRKPERRSWPPYIRPIFQAVYGHAAECEDSACGVPWCDFFSCLQETPDSDFDYCLNRLHGRYLTGYGPSGIVQTPSQDDTLHVLALNPPVMRCDCDLLMPEEHRSYTLLAARCQYRLTTDLSAYGYTEPNSQNWVIRRMSLTTLDALREIAGLENPHVVQLLWAIEHPDGLTVFERQETGRTLRELICNECPDGMDLQSVWRVMVDMLRGNLFLLEHCVCFLNHTAAAVTLSSSGLRLTDFSHAASLREPGSPETVRSIRENLPPHLIRPEMFQCRLSSTIDSWGVAALAAETSSGRHIYDELRHAAPQEARRRIEANPIPSLDGFSQDLLDFLRACFQVDPNNRPGLQEMLCVVEQITGIIPQSKGQGHSQEVEGHNAQGCHSQQEHHS